jgi:enoyl-[acyl-carrier protein] reductase I
MLDLSNKKYLVVGIANEKSIAWGIAQSLHQAGAQLAFTFLNEALEKRVRPLAEEVGCKLVLKCDVQNDDELVSVAGSIKEAWGSLDGIVHAVAFAERADLQGRFIETSRSGFYTALDVSAFSLIALVRELRGLLAVKGGSVLTLSYLGSNRVVDNYKVMGVAKAALESAVRYIASDVGSEGIRVNCISAGPIKTLAASGIPKFREMLAHVAERSPLKRNVSQEDIGRAALYFLSELSAAVTGEVHYVDCGYNFVGL